MAPPSCTWFLFLLFDLQGAKTLEATKDLYFTVPETGSKIDQKHVDGYAFFMCMQYKVTGKFQKVQNVKFSTFLSEQNVYVSYF